MHLLPRYVIALIYMYTFLPICPNNTETRLPFFPLFPFSDTTDQTTAYEPNTQTLNAPDTTRDTKPQREAPTQPEAQR